MSRSGLSVDSGAAQTFYVEETGNDALDGKTPGRAVATIAQARTLLGANAGTIRLGKGTFDLPVLDGNGNGLTLDHKGQRIIGQGVNATTVRLTNAVSAYKWGVALVASDCTAEGFELTIEAGASVYWGLGVTTSGSSGSAERCELRRARVSYNAAAVVPTIPGGTSSQPPAGIALGPEWPGSSGLDIFLTHLNQTYVNAADLAIDAYVIGNGTVGNILATLAVNCYGVHSQNGCRLAGSGIVWHGGGFGETSVSTPLAGADVVIAQGTTSDPIHFSGVRSEGGSGRVLKAGVVASPTTVIFDDWHAMGYSTSDGRLIDYTAGGTVRLLGGNFQTTLHTTNFVLSGTSSKQTTLIAEDVTADANPYPADAQYLTKIIRRPRLNWSGGVAVNPKPLSAFDTRLGVFAPDAVGWRANTGTMTGARCYWARWVAPRDMLIATVGFNVNTAAGANDSVDVGIYQASGTSLALLASSGPTAGKINGTGRQTIALTSALQVYEGQVYYCAINFPTFGGTAPVFVIADFGTGFPPDAIGSAAGQRLTGFSSGTGTMAGSIAAGSQNAVAAAPMLMALE